LRILVAHGRLLVGHLFGRSLIGLSVGKTPAHLLLEILLLPGQPLGLISQIAHLGSGLLFLHVLQSLIGLAHPLGRSLRIGGRLSAVLLASGCRVAHLALRLLHLIDGLLKLTGLALAQAVAGEALLSLLSRLLPGLLTRLLPALPTRLLAALLLSGLLATLLLSRLLPRLLLPRLLLP